MISGSLGGKDTGESPIEGSGGGARGELSSANCGIALYDSMPAPLTLLKLQYPPVRQFQGAVISVGTMWVAAGFGGDGHKIYVAPLHDVYNILLRQVLQQPRVGVDGIARVTTRGCFYSNGSRRYG